MFKDIIQQKEENIKEFDHNDSDNKDNNLFSHSDIIKSDINDISTNNNNNLLNNNDNIEDNKIFENKDKEKESENKNDKKIDNKRKVKLSYNDINNTINEINESLQLAFDDFIDNKVETETLDEIETISTGIDVLDAILGGGIALGNFSVFVGNPGSGKSTLAVKPIVNLQQKYGNKCLCLYLDSEETMSTKRLDELGVSRPKLKPKSNITIEKLFEIIEGIILFKEEKNIMDYPVLIVWDSIANTITNKDLTAKDINETIGLKARILSTMLPKYISKMRTYNITLLAINQLREKLQMGLFQTAPDLKYLGQERDMPGGQAIKFNAAQLINIKQKSDLKKDQYGFDGIRVSVKTVKNKLRLPNQECEIVLNFKTGFDNFWSNYIFLADKKYIKTGAWNKLDNYNEKSFRTNEAKILYETDEKFRNCFDELTKECIKNEIINKY